MGLTNNTAAVPVPVEEHFINDENVVFEDDNTENDDT
jgi:hypothetical protein